MKKKNKIIEYFLSSKKFFFCVCIKWLTLMLKNIQMPKFTQQQSVIKNYFG